MIDFNPLSLASSFPKHATSFESMIPRDTKEHCDCEKHFLELIHFDYPDRLYSERTCWKCGRKWEQEYDEETGLPLKEILSNNKKESTLKENIVEQEFISIDGQEFFKITDVGYISDKDKLEVFVNGSRQYSAEYERLSSHLIHFPVGKSKGDRIVIRVIRYGTEGTVDFFNRGDSFQARLCSDMYINGVRRNIKNVYVGPFYTESGGARLSRIESIATFPNMVTMSHELPEITPDYADQARQITKEMSKRIEEDINRDINTMLYMLY